MHKLIVANWKMNPQTYKEAEDLVSYVVENTKTLSGAEVVLCPPFTWLTDFSHKNESQVSFGAQDVFYEEKGAYTGGISAQMLKNSKVEYVIVGHSERRNYFGETDEMVNKKIKAALAVGLKVILCVGEDAGEDKPQILENQLTKAFEGVLASHIKDMVIAYEPVWAIGTGKNCSVDETVNAILVIKKVILSLYGAKVAEDMRILYGGSVNSKNSAEYLDNKEVGGLLVGGASLRTEEFIEIVKSAG